MKLVYVLCASLFLIATSTISLTKAKNLYESKPDNVLSYETTKERKIEYVLTPVLKSRLPALDLSSQAILAIDLTTNKTLYNKNPDTPLLPASTTKIITALVAMDKYPLDLILTVGDVGIEGQKMDLVAGERITVKNLLYGLLVKSGNDAAEALAQNYPGGRDAFILAMNAKAQDLGLKNSYFTNPSGLDGEMHRSTARDLVKASVFAMQRPFFKKAVSTKEIEVSSVDGAIVHRLININELLGEVEGVAGIKTGWTEGARENLVTYVERGEKKVITAVLGSQDRFGDTRQLIDWIYDNYEWENLPVEVNSSYSVSLPEPE